MKNAKKICLVLALVLMIGCFASCSGSKGSVKIETADDLIGKTIGVQLGTTGDIVIAGEIEGATVKQYAKAVDAAIALADGKIDAVIVDLEPAKNIVAANPKLKIQESIKYDPEDYAIAVKKGNTELLGLIDVVLTEIKSDGTYDNLVKGFIDTPQDQRDAYITGEQVGTEGTLTVNKASLSGWVMKGYLYFYGDGAEMATADITAELPADNRFDYRDVAAAGKRKSPCRGRVQQWLQRIFP